MIDLLMCWNYHRTGCFDGLLRQICLRDPDALTLESPFFDRHLKADVWVKGFRLGTSHYWQHHGHSTWVGSWCWDQLRVTPACAADVINFVLSKGYKPTVGAQTLWGKIDAGEKLTGADLATYQR